jgi:hypothetical protein
MMMIAAVALMAIDFVVRTGLVWRILAIVLLAGGWFVLRREWRGAQPDGSDSR